MVGQCWLPTDTPEQHSGLGTPHSSTSALMPTNDRGLWDKPVSCESSVPSPASHSTHHQGGGEQEGRGEMGSLATLGMAPDADFPYSWTFHHIPQHSEGATVNPPPQTRTLRLREVR